MSYFFSIDGFIFSLPPPASFLLVTTTIPLQGPMLRNWYGLGRVIEECFLSDILAKLTPEKLSHLSTLHWVPSSWGLSCSSRSSMLRLHYLFALPRGQSVGTRWSEQVYSSCIETVLWNCFSHVSASVRARLSIQSNARLPDFMCLPSSGESMNRALLTPCTRGSNTIGVGCIYLALFLKSASLGLR